MHRFWGLGREHLWGGRGCNSAYHSSQLERKLEVRYRLALSICVCWFLWAELNNLFKFFMLKVSLIHPSDVFCHLSE